jgi:hypothetical protein
MISGSIFDTVHTQMVDLIGKVGFLCIKGLISYVFSVHEALNESVTTERRYQILMHRLWTVKSNASAVSFGSGCLTSPKPGFYSV